MKYGCFLLSLTIIKEGICRYDLTLFVLEGLDCSVPEQQDKDNATWPQYMSWATNNIVQLNADKIKAEYKESLKETCKIFQNLIAKGNLEFF